MTLAQALTSVLRPSAKVIVLILAQLSAPALMAESGMPDWSAELYGGRYYDDSRAGAYLVLSNPSNDGVTIIGEALLERYPDYRFAGLGAHLLWSAGVIGDLGFVASQAWERYEFSPSMETDYETRIVGAEWELEKGRLAVAAQVGKYLKDYSGDEPEYLSADIYYWGAQHDWYLRGSTRRFSGSSLNLFEVYRIFHASGLPITAYVGVGTDDQSLASPGNRDSVYAGAYAEIRSTPDSTLTLWFEAAAEDNDTLFTIELNLALGPGARAPYITAFGFSLDN